MKVSKVLIFTILIALVLLGFGLNAYASYTSFIPTDAFSGIQSDVNTIGAGIISIFLSIAGIFFIMKAFGH